jgi:CRISPR-associated endonuclease/helicase Cas3
MDSLAASDFAEYFRGVYGSSPFPWQQRLLDQVALDARWPALLDLPTGSGKTAAIDVALFHLALDAAAAPAARRAPRRIVLVVDRRTVVDQAFERAQTVQRALAGASGGVLRVVRERLASLCEGEPIACAQLRGGMPRDDAWARRPDQPLVAVSTVDQVGSRLLFRGYGVSDAMRPIHAGLLGHDTLFLLDEVHLSQPFLETLESLALYRARSPRGLPDRWQFVAMSATPGKAKAAFGLSDEDRCDPHLAARLLASKPIECEMVKGARFAERVAERIAPLALPGRCVGAVVNRVAAALEVFHQVRRSCPGSRTFLVTGRMRALDRKELEGELSVLVRSGRERSLEAAPVVVVATQCIEAGADFDFDALVTECASLDALRQRFGRLNRLGTQQDAPGVVLCRSEAVAANATDFVYGEALAATWRWLESAPRDFGIDAMKNALPDGEELAIMLPKASRAPVMLPAHLDAWVQTAPAPRPDPDVSLWLHGVDQDPEVDVQIVWRADVTAELLEHAGEGDDKAMSSLLARLELCPPDGLEALSVPVAAARAWLDGIEPPDVADVEGATAAEERRRAANSGRCAILWRGDDSRVVSSGGVRPGMTLVVPSAYGGLSAGTWDPSATEPVVDLGDRARWEHTGRATLRLHHALVKPGWNAPRPADPDDPDDDERERVVGWLQSVEDAPFPTWMRELVAAMRKATKRSPRRLVVVHVDDEAEAAGYLALLLRGQGADVSTEDDSSSLTGVEVTLREHMTGVASWADRFARQCGLPEGVARDVVLAARWHDAGKVDPRFQRMLRGGSPLSDVAAEPIAKSRMIARDRVARQRARELSRYPKGGRHELSSVTLLEQGAALLAEAHDRELVLHLVASHHGWCRPFAPVVEDPEPVELVLDAGSVQVRASSKHELGALDSGIADRFWRLVDRYGWYGLAWLEAILRLADHRRSEWEQVHSAEEKERT